MTLDHSLLIFQTGVIIAIIQKLRKISARVEGRLLSSTRPGPQVDPWRAA